MKMHLMSLIFLICKMKNIDKQDMNKLFEKALYICKTKING